MKITGFGHSALRLDAGDSVDMIGPDAGAFVAAMGYQGSRVEVFAVGGGIEV